ncbi:3-ketosteroid-delta-1-dehydrogenase [Streptomyces sp. alain-838]|nr:FAD-binding protein [Streptomyces sp. alain-838]PAK28065.1 3-ketosteroid-delta-1-dehydrogenase [Streptomyces sp. alain-838]
MTDWDYVTDFLVIGSGGGLVGALRAAALGREALVVEKTEFIGGSTGMSGGVLWLPDNPLLRRKGIEDSADKGLAYFSDAVGEPGPGTTIERRRTYIRAGREMVQFLEREGVRFRHCDGYSDYYSGARGIRGGLARGRSLECEPYDVTRLGPWQRFLRPSAAGNLVLFTGEVATVVLLRRSRKALATAARVAARTVGSRVRGRKLVTNGASLVAHILAPMIHRNVPVWTRSAFEDFVVEDGRVVGALIRKGDRTLRVRARDGVLVTAGGFARNKEMREEFSPQPNSAQWTSANPGDTGEVMRAAMRLGAATAALDEALWIPSVVMPDGKAVMFNNERGKPGAIVVDAEGHRFFNESVAYMEAGQSMYRHQRETGSGVPSWLIIDSRHRSRYMFAGSMPGRTPEEWLRSGFLKRSETLDGLAAQCGLPAKELAATVERFNRMADAGVDEDFHRGEGDHERYQGDFTHRPNACLGPVEKAPFYAVRIYPGDVGTAGGVVCDEHARVLDADGLPIPGLYAAGNCTASVMGRTYPGAGASIGNSAVFSYVAANDAAAGVAAGGRSEGVETSGLPRCRHRGRGRLPWLTCSWTGTVTPRSSPSTALSA